MHQQINLFMDLWIYGPQGVWTRYNKFWKAKHDDEKGDQTDEGGGRVESGGDIIVLSWAPTLQHTTQADRDHPQEHTSQADHLQGNT